MAEDQVTAPQEESDAQAAPASPEAAAPEETQAASQPAPQLAAGKQFVWGTGRRKTAVARVRIRPGTGKFIVNKREATAYFTHERDRQVILGPLEAAKMLKQAGASMVAVAVVARAQGTK